MMPGIGKAWSKSSDRQHGSSLRSRLLAVRGLLVSATDDFQSLGDALSPIMTMAAKAGLWTIGNKAAKAFAAHCALPSGAECSSLFETVRPAVSGILKCSDIKGFDIRSCELQNFTADCMDALVETGEWYRRAGPAKGRTRAKGEVKSEGRNLTGVRG